MRNYEDFFSTFILVFWSSGTTMNSPSESPIKHDELPAYTSQHSVLQSRD